MPLSGSKNRSFLGFFSKEVSQNEASCSLVTGFTRSLGSQGICRTNLSAITCRVQGFARCLPDYPLKEA